MTPIAPITGMLLIRKSRMRTRPRCCFRAHQFAGRCGPTVLASLTASLVTAIAAKNSRWQRMCTSSSLQIHSLCVTCSEQPSTGERSASMTAKGGYQKKSLLSSHATQSIESPEALPTGRCIRSCCIRTSHGIRFRSTLTTPSSAAIFARTLAVSCFQTPHHQTRIMSFQASRSACKQLSFS